MSPSSAWLHWSALTTPRQPCQQTWLQAPAQDRCLQPCVYPGGARCLSGWGGHPWPPCKQGVDCNVAPWPARASWYPLGACLHSSSLVVLRRLGLATKAMRRSRLASTGGRTVLHQGSIRFSELCTQLNKTCIDIKYAHIIHTAYI